MLRFGCIRMVKRKRKCQKEDLGTGQAGKKLKIDSERSRIVDGSTSKEEVEGKGLQIEVQTENVKRAKKKFKVRKKNLMKIEENAGTNDGEADLGAADHAGKKLNIDPERMGIVDESLSEEEDKGKGLQIEVHKDNVKNAKKKLKVKKKLKTAEENAGIKDGIVDSGADHSGKKLRIDHLERIHIVDVCEEEDKVKGLQIEVHKDNVKKAKKKLKVEKKKVKTTEENAGIKDRLSELPDHIIHHILGFLQNPKDAARTRILSKKWKSIWDSFPVFDFDQRCYKSQHALRNPRGHCSRESEVENFKGFVDKSIAIRLEPMPSIQKFKLYVSSYSYALAPSMHFWILMAVTKNVKDLDIHVHHKEIEFTLSRAVFLSKTITSLKLYGLQVDHVSIIKLDNLQVLSIKEARVDADMIEKFISNCPLIEDLRLVNCNGLSKLHISAHGKLTRVELHECSGLTDVEIVSPNLETFWFHGKKDSQCNINLGSCSSLKDFTLKDSHITDELFSDQLCKFPNLEKLVLVECTKLERITISSDIIKQLSLVRCWKLEEANIDAPNLTSFEYTGKRVPFSSMNISRLYDVKLNFLFVKRRHSYHLELESFFRKFSQHEGFKLFVCSQQTATIYDEFKGTLGLPSPNCKLEFTRSSTKLRELADSWLSKIHFSTLNVMPSSGGDFLKFVQDIIPSQAKRLECCQFYSNKCWRHYLENVKMSCGAADQKTFRLKWKPRRALTDSHNAFK